MLPENEWSPEEIAALEASEAEDDNWPSHLIWSPWCEDGCCL